MGDRITELDTIATAVGRVCYYWSQIEHLVHDLVLHTASALDPAFDQNRPRHVLHVTLSSMEMRERLVTLKVLLHDAGGRLSPTLYDQTEPLINYLDNVLRPERNRFVHDLWEFGEDGRWSRVKTGPRVYRPQSHDRATSLFTRREYASVDQITSFAGTLLLMYNDLVEVDNHLAWLTSQKELPTGSTQPLPAEWKSLGHHAWRTPDMPERQPPPSAG